MPPPSCFWHQLLQSASVLDLRNVSVLLYALIVGGCVVFAPAPVLGQAEATLRVVVTAADDGRPLQGANVVLTTVADGAFVRGGATNHDGYHQMRELAPGRYAIEVSRVGFKTHRDTLRLSSGRRVHRVALTVKPRRLEEVRVEGERGIALRQAGRETIQAAELERIPTPGPTGDLASYLQTLPGVVSVGDRGGQLFIQGGAPTQNRYLIDGLPIVRPFHISSFYSAFPQDVIQSADLYAGGFGAQYGEAISSVLDVRLRPGNLKEFSGSGAAGPHLAALRVEGPIVRGEQSFLVSARRSLIEETAGPLFGEEEPISFYDVMGRYTFQEENTSCNVTTVFTNDRGSLTPDRDRELSWSNTVIGGRCLFFTEQLENTFSVRGGYTGFENEFGTVGSPERTASRWRLYLMLDQDLTFLGQPVDFGAKVTGGKYDAQINRPFVGQETFEDAQGMVRVHWSLDWSTNDYLTVSPSLAARVEFSNVPTFDPRLRLSVRPDGTEQQEISVAAGLYHQIDAGITDVRDAGTAFTVWRPPREDDPLPQALQAILGYRQRLGSAFEVSVEGYAKRLQDILVPKWTPRIGVNTETARADGEIYGANARLEFRRGGFRTNLGYGWSTVTYEAATDDLGAWIGGRVFSFSPGHDRQHQVTAVTSYEFMGTTASVSWEFGTGRPLTQIRGFDLALDVPDQDPTAQPGTPQTIFERPFGARLPPTHRLDASLQRSFDLGGPLALDTKIGAINVYDRRNVFFFDVDTLQRVDQSPLLPYFSLKLRVN